MVDFTGRPTFQKFKTFGKFLENHKDLPIAGL